MPGSATARHDDVRRLFRQIEDGKCAAILRTGAMIAELEEVAAWIAAEDDVMGELERPLRGTAAEVYDILTADEVPDDDEM